MTSELSQMLDELMGKNRNAAPDDKSQDVHWSDKDSYQQSLRYMKMSYEEEFLHYLQQCMTDVERRIRRNHQRLQLNEEKNQKPAPAPNKDSEEQINLLTQRIEELLKKIEELGNDGNIEEAQGVMKLCDQLKEDRENLHNQQKGNEQIRKKAEAPVVEEKKRVEEKEDDKRSVDRNRDLDRDRDRDQDRRRSRDHDTRRSRDDRRDSRRYDDRRDSGRRRSRERDRDRGYHSRSRDDRDRRTSYRSRSRDRDRRHSRKHSRPRSRSRDRKDSKKPRRSGSRDRKHKSEAASEKSKGTDNVANNVDEQNEKMTTVEITNDHGENNNANGKQLHSSSADDNANASESVEQPCSTEGDQ